MKLLKIKVLNCSHSGVSFVPIFNIEGKLQINEAIAATIAVMMWS